MVHTDADAYAAMASPCTPLLRARVREHAGGRAQGLHCCHAGSLVFVHSP